MSPSSGVRGSKYSRSAVSKSVDTVSGLLLTMTTSYPRLLQGPDAVDRGVVELDALARSGWDPEPNTTTGFLSPPCSRMNVSASFSSS